MNVKCKNRPKSLEDLVRLNINTTGLSDIEIDEVISSSFNVLSYRSQAVLTKRLIEGRTQVDIGRDYNVSAQRIRDIYDKAEKKFLSRASDLVESMKNGQESLHLLCLSVRAYNSLRRAGISTISELEKADFLEMYNVKGIGIAGMNEIKTAYRNWLSKSQVDSLPIVNISFKKAILLGL